MAIQAIQLRPPSPTSILREIDRVGATLISTPIIMKLLQIRDELLRYKSLSVLL